MDAVNPKNITRLIGGSVTGERRERDFYPTPAKCTHNLIDVESFHGNIWEPACGDGAIVKVLRQRCPDAERIIATDIHDYGFPMDTQIDFFKTNKKSWDIDNIITNPPFGISTEFTLHALKIARRKVALFQKITFLEGINRYEKLFTKFPLKKVWVYVRRVSFPKDGATSGGMMCFAWFIFDKGYTGCPKLGWIE